MKVLASVISLEKRSVRTENGNFAVRVVEDSGDVNLSRRIDSDASYFILTKVGAAAEQARKDKRWIDDQWAGRIEAAHPESDLVGGQQSKAAVYRHTPVVDLLIDVRLLQANLAGAQVQRQVWGLFPMWLSIAVHRRDGKEIQRLPASAGFPWNAPMTR